jgi:dimethylargininase
VQCELTHVERAPIDVRLARRQHEAYEACLVRAGCRVERLPAGSDMADSVFIEDAAVVLDEVAIVTRPGALSRRIETAAVAAALQPYRPLAHVEAPGTVDGGDVLVIGRRVFIGRSSRTNDAGIAQVRGALSPYGYEVTTVEVQGCLHLKSAATVVGDQLLLINGGWLPSAPFVAFDRIEVDAGEPSAANALRVGDQIMFPTSFPKTLARLERRGLRILPVDMSELAKAEGAVTCCSLIFKA